MTDPISLLRELDPEPGPTNAPPLGPLMEHVQRQDAGARRPGRGRTRRLWMPAAAVTAVAVALLAVALVGNPGRGDLDVAAAAYRATAPGQGITHIVMEVTTTGLPGDEVQPSDRLETWNAPAEGQFRAVQTTGDRVIEWTTDQKQLKTWTSWGEPNQVTVMPIDEGDPPTPADPIASLRAQYRSGKVRVVGQTTSSGTDVWQLRVPMAQPPGPGSPRSTLTISVNAKSFAPETATIETTIPDSAGGGDRPVSRTSIRYLTYEQAPYSSTTAQTLQMAPH